MVGDLENPEPAADEVIDPSSFTSFTRTGSLLGTPSYMSPEQFAGSNHIGPATDIWALGVVVYECLIGAVPFTGRQLVELFDAVVERRFRKISELRPSLPTELDAWFDRACAARPEDRFASPAEALSGLAAALPVGTPIGLSVETSGPIPFSPVFSDS